MSDSSSWFYIWVPTKAQEREARARSRSRTSSDRASKDFSEARSVPSSFSRDSRPSSYAAQSRRSSNSKDSLDHDKEHRPSLPSIREDPSALDVTQNSYPDATTAKSETDSPSQPKKSKNNPTESENQGSTAKSRATSAANSTTTSVAGSDVARPGSVASSKVKNQSQDESFDSQQDDDSDPLLKRRPSDDDPPPPPGDNEDDHSTLNSRMEDDQHSVVSSDDHAKDRSTMSFVEWEPMEDVCRKLLENLKIKPYSLQYSSDGAQVLFVFSVPQESLEAILLEFQNQGIGNSGLSTISVVPAKIHFSTHQPPVTKSSEKQSVQMDSFYSSVKSRLLVAEVIARIQAGAEFSFDYLMLLSLAGMIAVLGLIENSSVVLVASMLVSPLMGPILAGIFGGVIQDPELTRKGIFYEVVSLVICIGIGFLFGLIISPIAEVYGCPQWPTSEMLSRGEARSLWVGALIAIPSGAGVALSVLGGNAGSLVGVAISASLLPPAVNCGIFWAMAITLSIGGQSSLSGFHGFGEQEIDNQTRSMYEPRYSDSMAIESFLLGLISLLLTLINILCIILTGIAILRLKEVTPEKIPQKFSNFWRRDIKAHRNYYKTWTKEDNIKLLAEFQNSGMPVRTSDGLEGTFLQSMFDRASQDNDLINIKQWVTMPTSTLPPGLINDQVPEVMTTPQNKAEFPVKGKSAPGSERRAPRERSPYPQMPATCNVTYRPSRRNNNTYLNISNFFASELRRSCEFRKRLYSTNSMNEEV